MEKMNDPIPEQASPGITRPALDIGGPGCPSGRATGTKNNEHRTRRKWTREENTKVMECYYRSQPHKRGYRKRMHEIWREQNPESSINEQGLLNQKRAIEKNKLLTDIECQLIERNQKDERDDKAIEEVENQTAPIIENGRMSTIERKEVSQMTIEETQTKEKLIEYMAKYSNIETRPAIRKVPSTKETRNVINEVDKVISTIDTRSLTDLNTVIFAGAKYVEDCILPARSKSHSESNEMPPWRQRITRQISDLRKEANQLTAAWKHNGRIPRQLWSKYQLDTHGIPEAAEKAKQRLIATNHKLQRYDARNEQQKINKTFRENPRQAYQLICKKRIDAPKLSQCEKENIKKYWTQLWSSPIKHDDNTVWLKEITQKHSQRTPQLNVNITEQDVYMKLRRMANWKATGPDRVHAFWLKNFSTLHNKMAESLNMLLDNTEDIPAWLVRGRTQLIKKVEREESNPQNFRPITCLSTMWKLLSGIISDKMLQYLNTNDILCFEQKGIRPGSRGTKDQLAIDRSITKDNKQRRTNMAMAWIDYRKAYDSVPHSWIIKCMDIYKVNQTIKEFIKRSMSKWETQLMCGKQEITKVKVKRGIFQGDSLSPLLFCMAINPLSEILHLSGKEYTLKTKEKINHLLYMDDLKLFSKNEDGLNTLVHTVRMFSNDIQMEFGYDKCAMLVIQRGKLTKSEGIDVEGKTIPDISQEDQSYKYLGIPQQHTNLEEQTKHDATKEYKKRLKQILKSKLNAKNKIEAINAYAIPIIRYTAGIIRWTMDETNALNRKTRKILNMYGALHPRADVERLYLPRKLGGRGLMNIRHTIQTEERSLTQYMWGNKEDPLLSIAKRNDTYKENAEPLETWRRNQNEEKQKAWKDKPLHGQYPKQMEELVPTEHCYEWLKTVNLKVETEALLIAAQDQALNTKAHKTHIMKTTQDPLCRMCKSKDETVAHILAGCSKLALTEYLKRHNEVARLIHKSICDEYGIPTVTQYWKHDPQPVTENNTVKILWDFDVQTARHITARRPDLVVIKKNENETLIIDIAVPEDRNICDKEKEKIMKYQDLRLEIKRIWNTKVTVIPVVIGALGSHTAMLHKYLERIPGSHKVNALTKAALLGTAHILRKVLDLPESW